MATQPKRTTIYFDPNLHKALRLKAVETSRSVSELVNEAVREALSDDAEDLLAFEERANETLISYEETVKRLKKDGPGIRNNKFRKLRGVATVRMTTDEIMALTRKD